MLDKIAKGMNNGINPKLNMTSFQLLKYNHNHKINFTRVDEKRNNLFNLNYFFFAYILIAKSGYLHLAGVARLELTTFGFGDRRSTN